MDTTLPHEDVIDAERAHRLAKLDDLRERGIDPYPATFDREHTAAELHGQYGARTPDLVTSLTTRVAGRIMLLRRHGGAVFATLADETGTIQLLASRDELGDEAFADVEALDRGDWVGATGTVMTTHSGELTVDVSDVRLLSKALRALPDKHAGLTDPEVRVRERYLDLIVNPHTRRVFDARAAVIASIRRTLVDRGFVEVETPVLEAQAGGAAARPFVTHHNALDVDLYLRIAHELPLKRLVVGGFERVFEIAPVFRNEGLDTRHNPEFTLLEAYQALGDYHDMMELVETLVAGAAVAANGTTAIAVDGRHVDLAPPWRRATMAELIAEQTGERMHPSMPIEDARAICARLGIDVETEWGAGRLMSEVYDETVEHTLVDPTFVMDHPREISPLARTHRDDRDLVERFEVVVAGRELANAYSELNDPVDQRERFEAESGQVDQDYVRALEYGLPPTGGLGIGIDRLVMLIAGADAIREVILFPAMRPEGESSAPPAPAAPAAAPPPVPVVAAPAVPCPRLAVTRRLGGLTALAGLVLLFAHLIAGVPSAGVAPHVATSVIGLALVLVAVPLRLGKQRAWAAAIGLFAAGGVLAYVKGPDAVAMSVATVMLIALVWYRDQFTGRADPGSLLDVARAIATIAVLAVVLYLLTPDGPFRDAALAAIGIAGLIAVSLLAFRSVRHDDAPTAAARARARALVRAYGDDTLDYFALRPDKSYFFSAAGDAMIAYAYLGGHALAAADAIGAPGSRERVIEEFLAHCRERGWRVAFLGARERDLEIYRGLGLHGVYMGDEAIVHCDRFSLNGSAMKGVRSAVSRVGRRCTFRLMPETDASPELIGRLNELRARWRAGEAERGFTMELGGDVRGQDGELMLAVAFGPDDRPLGFLRLAPCFGDDPGWSLDLMQHDPDAPNGMTEYLIAMAAQELGRRGYRRLSLNFATWGRLFAEDARLRPLERVQREIARRLSPYFQITSLRDFNARFDPEWVPRTIVVEDREDLAKVAVLYASVEGFLRLPVIGSRLVPAVPS